MVRRAYTEKRAGMSPEAARLLDDLRNFLGIESLKNVRILNRYDLEGISDDAYEKAKTTILSEPPADLIWDETCPDPGEGWTSLIVEALPGQFDQRADSLAQCVAMMTEGERPLVASAKVYFFEGDLSESDLEKIRGHLINAVDARQATAELPETLKRITADPPMVETLTGFISLDASELETLRERLGLAMDAADLAFLQAYFRDDEKRDPTITEVRVVDTYWSDHCRHTTFQTHLQDVNIESPEVQNAWEAYLNLRREVYGKDAENRPVTLMDIATIGAKALKKRNLLPELDESEEINACSIHVPATVNGEEQDWLLMFKNETHNHPTEIEPFGGAATCIGGCIRDPLSGRAYVHQAMRVTGGGDPRTPFSKTLPGKLPQRQIARTAADGYSSYGNQIGLATGHVAEVYHPGFVAKHLETGAVVGAVRADHVRRETPEAGDVVILLGGRTGRDGIGGATGSSKTHNLSSLSTMASEVQKGNAPEERKLQRLFRNPEVTGLIKRCNDFGAGGVAVAIGELADGLDIDLDAVRKKYDGLDGTELAISESQERMAVVTAKEDAQAFIDAAGKENLEAYIVAQVKEDPRMTMRWRGTTILDLSRAFLNTNGATKKADVRVKSSALKKETEKPGLRKLASDLAFASRRGLTEQFDSTVGAGSVLMPFGGTYQRTPEQVMAALLPMLPGDQTTQASVMSWAYDPDWMSADPYAGALGSVTMSLAKLTAAGADWKKAYLTLQEYFERLGEDPERWAQPFQALLGALAGQMTFGRPAIGGKDSMSGTFLDLDVPPTVISFAVAPVEASKIISAAFKGTDHPVYCFMPHNGENLSAAWDAFQAYADSGHVKAAYAVERTGQAAIMNMSFGNGIGFSEENAAYQWGDPLPGSIVAELDARIEDPHAVLMGFTQEEPIIRIEDESVPIQDLLKLSENVLEEVYPVTAAVPDDVPEILFTHDKLKSARNQTSTASPRVVIPVFPGTNCEYDSARVCLEAGLTPEIFVVRNLTPGDLTQSIQELERLLRNAQILFLPGGFSGGDEPEGSAKFIAAMLRNTRISDAIEELLQERQGLILGICNGFQALIKTGLVPYGHIQDLDPEAPTLTYNAIGRHQSKIVRTRIRSTLSPWFLKADPEEIYTVPISHGEGRFAASPGMLRNLEKNGQIATQYVDLDGKPSMHTDFNPNGSVWAIEGITSPDGQVLGKMGHSERFGRSLYQNVPGNYDMRLFESAAEYFR